MKASVEGNTTYRFVDTAGIRRKGKTTEMTEKLSVVMARRHIRMANVVLLMVDATEGVVGSDATIAGYAHEEGRCVIVVVNKWDAAGDEKGKRAFTETVRDELKFLDYAPIIFASAKNKEGIRRIFSTIRRCFDNASKRVEDGRIKPVRCRAEVRERHQDLLHDTSFRTASDIRSVHRQGGQDALFGRAIPDQPASRTVWIRRDSDRDPN